MNRENGDEVIDFGEILDKKAEEILFGKNNNRAAALRELWFKDIQEMIEGMEAPEDKRHEIIFLAASNSVLDMVLDIIPPDLALTLARNIDEFLKVTLVNREFGTDLMRQFQEDFAEEKGTDFASQEELDEVAGVFEEKWWNTPLAELGGKSPNRVMKEIGERYGI